MHQINDGEILCAVCEKEFSNRKSSCDTVNTAEQI